jgi:pyruvate, water dikinase
MSQERKFTLWFDEIRIEDVPIVGGKNASLGEMYQDLAPQGVKIPNGFASTSDAYWHFLNSADILDKLKDAMSGLNKVDVNDLATRGKRARELILKSDLPEDLWMDIKEAYDKLGEEYGTDVARA